MNDRLHPKGPNFLLIVIFSGVFLVVFMVAAYFVVGAAGMKFLPRVRPLNTEPTSYLVLPASKSVEAYSSTLS